MREERLDKRDERYLSGLEKTLRTAFSQLLAQRSTEVAKEALLTLREVRVSAKGQEALFYLSVYPAQHRQQVAQRFEQHATEWKHALAHLLSQKIGRLPKIRVLFDSTEEKAQRVQQLFKK